MLLLALDTATPTLTVGLVELTDTGLTQRSLRAQPSARRHAELLMPAVDAACRDAATRLRDLDAVVVGVGPGPYTGLRVGMVTAAALGDALDLPVHGVCTLDAIARDAVDAAPDGLDGDLLVVSDAKRREVYWATYDAHARRIGGPDVEPTTRLVERVAELDVVAVAGDQAERFGLPVRGPEFPSPTGLVRVVEPGLRRGVVPGPLVPLYLRRPDAVEPGPRKRVTA